jgi:hypothetical protein
MKKMSKLAHFCSGAFFAAALVAGFGLVNAAIAAPPNADATPAQVTFSKDVAPIFQEKCQSCHRDGAMAPMALTSYKEARPYARAIKQRVVMRTMPPWFLDKTVGVQDFKNDMSLTDAQMQTIVKWVDEGAPEGNPRDMPAAKVFDDDGSWQLAKQLGRPPDLILEAPDYTVKKGDQDQWFRPVTDTGLTEPRWVMAVEIRPSNPESRKVFHHVLANLQQDETNAPEAQVKVSLGDEPKAANTSGMAGLLMEWAINKNYDLFRDGTGKLLMPGSKIWWEYHTHATDHDVTGHPILAVYFYPKGQTPKYRTYLTGMQAYNRADLDIPPNSITSTQGFTVMKAPARLENFQPHMHLRGKAMSMEAIYPDGKTEMISYEDNFNFNWMTNHIYSDEAAPVVPKGTIIHVTAWLDNTTANPFNPDPNQWSGYGERSVDDMAFAWVNVTYLSDQDYKDWLAKHPKKTAPKGEGIGEP